MDARNEDHTDNNAGDATRVSPTFEGVTEDLKEQASPMNDPPTEAGNSEELKPSDEVERDATNNEEESVNTEMHPPGGSETLAREKTEEKSTSSQIEFPLNVESPDMEDGDAIEIAAVLSREGTNIKEDPIDFRVENGPKATTTPPPVHEEISITQTVVTSESPQLEVPHDETCTPEFPIYDRAQLLEKYREALEERAQLQSLNTQLQHKLAEFFKRKKTDDRAQELDKSVTDQEQRYLKYMSNLEELHNEKKSLADTIKAQIEDLKTKCSEKQSKVQIASDEFSTFKYEVARDSVSNRSGKPLQPKDLEQIKTTEAKKEGEVIQVRLENIKLKNRLKKRELQLKAKEELAEGLHLIDFEQLKIENQTYNEKIEERNEELLKLRKKITTTVQVLTHVKEKLQFVQGENEQLRSEMYDVETSLAKKRDVLTRTKQVRDALRNDNMRLKQKCGLLGNEPLLRDFEERTDEGDELHDKLERLRQQHLELTMNLNGIKRKVEKARSKTAL